MLFFGCGEGIGCFGEFGACCLQSVLLSLGKLGLLTNILVRHDIKIKMVL